jgi:hypothetical protein
MLTHVSDHVKYVESYTIEASLGCRGVSKVLFKPLTLLILPPRPRLRRLRLSLEAVLIRLGLPSIGTSPESKLSSLVLDS